MNFIEFTNGDGQVSFVVHGANAIGGPFDGGWLATDQPVNEGNVLNIVHGNLVYQYLVTIGCNANYTGVVVK